MTTSSKTKSYPKPVLFKTYANNLAKSLHENNQQMRIYCLKPRSNKNKRECKKCGRDTFMCPIIKVFHL